MPEFVCNALLRRKKAQQEYFLTRNYLPEGSRRAGASRPRTRPSSSTSTPSACIQTPSAKWWERDRKLLGLDGWLPPRAAPLLPLDAAQQGVHPKVMQELAGHASATITMDIYTHVNMDQKREAADVMEDAFQSIGAEEEFMAKHAEDAPKGRPYKVRHVRPSRRTKAPEQAPDTNRGTIRTRFVPAARPPQVPIITTTPDLRVSEAI